MEELTRREHATDTWCATVPRFNNGAANFAPSDPGQVPGIFQHLGCCLCPANRLDDARDVVWRPGLLGCLRRTPRGEVPEWLNGAVSKTVVGASPPRVRIPLSPPYPLTSSHLYTYHLPRLSLYLWDNPGIKDISSPLASSPDHGIMWGQMWGWIVCQVKLTS